MQALAFPLKSWAGRLKKLWGWCFEVFLLVDALNKAMWDGFNLALESEKP